MADINDILSRLNSRYDEITDLVPDKMVFMDDFAYARNEYDQEIDNNPLGSQFYRLSSGKYIWVGRDGSDTDVNMNVRRYNSDLTLDETFMAPSFNGNDNGYVRSVVEQSNGKIVVVGHFDTVGETTAIRICRLNTDGSLDETFSSGDGFNNNALVVRVLGDDSLLVGGSFNQYNGVSVHRLVKLGANGALDETFSGYITLNNAVHEIFVDPDTGKIYVGGQFGSSLVRLNANGTLDGTFSVAFNDRVTSIKKGASGKILVGGWFNQCNSSSCNRGIVRLESTGSLDSSFQTEGSGLNNPNGAVQSIAIQPDGKVIVAGWSTEYNGEPSGLIVRLNSDGTRDTSFAVSYGFDHEENNWGARVQHVSLDSEGNVYCVGAFVQYNGSPCYSFAKLDSSANRLPGMLFAYPFSVGISDGINDMYDTGNFINTNLTQMFDDISGDDANDSECIPNTHSAISDESEIENNYPDMLYAPVMDGEVRSGEDYFGEGSHYFTNMYQGMFAMVATNVNIEEFSITGGLGSDGSTQNSDSVIVVHEGSTYTVFLKVNREGDGTEEGGDPSVNHLIIVPGSPDGLTQLINESNDYDDHCIRGLAGRSAIAYLLVSRAVSDFISDGDAEAVALKFLDVVGGLGGAQTFSARGGNEYDLSPQFVRQVGEGSLDTAIVVEDGERISIQRSLLLDIVDSQGNRKILEVSDGETWTDAPDVLAATNNPNGHPTFGANDRPSITEQVIPAGNPLSN